MLGGVDEMMGKVCAMSIGSGRCFALVLLGFCVARSVWAAEPDPILVTLKDHRFTPAEIHVPTGKPMILKIRNEDDTAEEFDSTALKVEKVVSPPMKPTVSPRRIVSEMAVPRRLNSMTSPIK